jgi:hypothetical protein
MEFAKKMVLVEPRQIEKWKENMQDKTLAKLDGEIYETLHRDVADDEKAKIYSNSLRRYLNINKPEIVKKFEWPEELVKEEEAAEDKTKNLETLMLNTVPNKWKKHASRLLTHMQKNANVDWSQKGELILNDKTIPKTHIADLVNDLLRKRVSSQVPAGWEQLADALKDSNVPHELIGNQERWRYINGTLEETPSVTSSRKRTKSQRNTVKYRKHPRYQNQPLWEEY